MRWPKNLFLSPVPGRRKIFFPLLVLPAPITCPQHQQKRLLFENIDNEEKNGRRFKTPTKATNATDNAQCRTSLNSGAIIVLQRGQFLARWNWQQIGANKKSVVPLNKKIK